MCSARRLKPEERKNEIKEAARKVFVSKGFANTTMEDIINETTMSKGGFYHYYKSTIDILHDLMVDGIHYRNEVIKSNLSEFKQGYEIEFIAKQLVEKILDDNLYMEIYVQFLIEKKRSKKLNSIFNQLKAQSREEFSQLQRNVPEFLLNDALYDFVTDFINSMILGADILEARDNFKKNKEIIEKMFVALFKERRKQNGKNNERKTFNG
ncbi:TetR/AcrR family transcriptional regulator [Facklamia sp. P12955]|uniref:TetR/AcrR family transcriptional regulator n=1 Tax=Facklamia sp. P12955 TaxID=3421946 RepID=UPI003D172B11